MNASRIYSLLFDRDVMLVYVNEGFSVWTLEVTWKCGILGVIAFSMWVEIYSGDKSDIENKTGSVMGGGWEGKFSL